MFPDEGLEKLLGIVERLTEKITDIDKTGFLDASVLGETVHPQNFNTLRRIRDEDGAVVEEQEHFAELASNEVLLQQVQQALADAARRKELEGLPDGIHSGLARQGARGVFFAFTAPVQKGDGRQHFWRYADLRDGHILDNRYLIANLIVCQPDTDRVVPLSGEVDIFELQESVAADILEQAQERRAVEEAPKIVDPLRSAYQEFSRTNDIQRLIDTLQAMPLDEHVAAAADTPPNRSLTRDDLHLVCFDYVWS